MMMLAQDAWNLAFFFQGMVSAYIVIYGLTH